MNPNTQAHEIIAKNRASSRTQMKHTTSGVPAAAHVNDGVAGHRKHLRFAFVAQADVTALRKGWHLMADLSQLSACGCYVDTPEPFNVGTEVRLCIRHAGNSCEVHGRVIYVHKGWGMGILFDDAAGQQFDVLDGWLAELEHKQGGTVSSKFVVATH
jgi:hypothetical protein